MAESWQLGSMNDGLFIIDRRPCHNEDGCFDDCPNAPTLVLNVTALSETHARAIVGAHNDAVDALRAATTPKVRFTEDGYTGVLDDLHTKLEDALSAAYGDTAVTLTIDELHIALDCINELRMEIESKNPDRRQPWTEYA